MRSKFILTAFCFCYFSAHAANTIEDSRMGSSGYTLQDGHFVKVETMAILPAQEHYNLGMDALEREYWPEAAKQFNILALNFPHTKFGQDAYYYLGASYYAMEEFDFANDAFSDYLKYQSNPTYFIEAIEYKYCIAEQFRFGARRHFLGTKQLPKWATGRTLALTIYDEIIASVPNHECAAQAMFSKGCLLWKLKEYRDSIEAYQMLNNRFPKHELTPESYLAIARIYLEQSQYEFQNPDILAFAELNVRRFQDQFPRDERVYEAKQFVLSIKEIYANGLFKTGQFYERVHQPRASIIYYQSAVNQFPDTSIAQRCRQRLSVLNPCATDQDDT